MLELLRGLGLIRVTVLGPLATIDVGHAGTPRNMLLFAVSTMGPAAWLGTTMLWVAHMLGKLGCEAGMLHCLSRCGEQFSHACRSHLNQAKIHTRKISDLGGRRCISNSFVGLGPRGWMVQTCISMV